MLNTACEQFRALLVWVCWGAWQPTRGSEPIGRRRKGDNVTTPHHVVSPSTLPLTGEALPGSLAAARYLPHECEVSLPPLRGACSASVSHGKRPIRPGKRSTPQMSVFPPTDGAVTPIVLFSNQLLNLPVRPAPPAQVDELEIRKKGSCKSKVGLCAVLLDLQRCLSLLTMRMAFRPSPGGQRSPPRISRG